MPPQASPSPPSLPVARAKEPHGDCRSPPTVKQWRLGRQRGAQTPRAWCSCACPATQLPKANSQSPPAQLCTPRPVQLLIKTQFPSGLTMQSAAPGGHTKAQHGAPTPRLRSGAATVCARSFCTCAGSPRPPRTRVSLVRNPAAPPGASAVHSWSPVGPQRRNCICRLEGFLDAGVAEDPGGGGSRERGGFQGHGETMTPRWRAGGQHPGGSGHQQGRGVASTWEPSTWNKAGFPGRESCGSLWPSLLPQPAPRVPKIMAPCPPAPATWGR